MIGDLDIFDTMSFEGATQPKPAPLGDPFDPGALLAAMTAFFDRWQGAHPRLTPMVGPSAPQRCSHELMEGLARLASDRSALFHTHVLETRNQIGANLERYGRSSVLYLEDLGLLTARSSLAHCVWMDPDEFSAVRRCGATIVHNPVSNLRCGSGILPVADLLEGGVSVALGADGAASNDNQNMFEAMEVRLADANPARNASAVAPAAHNLEDVSAGRGCGPGPAAGVAAPGPRRRHRASDRGASRARPRRWAGGQPGAGRARGVGAHRDRRRGGDGGRRRLHRVDDAAMAQRSRDLQRRIHQGLPDRQAFYDRYVDVLTEVHDHAMAQLAPVERLAVITPAFHELAAQDARLGAERCQFGDGAADGPTEGPAEGGQH